MLPDRLVDERIVVEWQRLWNRSFWLRGGGRLGASRFGDELDLDPLGEFVTESMLFLTGEGRFAFTLGVTELMGATQKEASGSFLYFEAFIVAAVMYWIVVEMLSWLQGNLETRLNKAYSR